MSGDPCKCPSQAHTPFCPQCGAAADPVLALLEFIENWAKTPDDDGGAPWGVWAGALRDRLYGQKLRVMRAAGTVVVGSMVTERDDGVIPAASNSNSDVIGTSLDNGESGDRVRVAVQDMTGQVTVEPGGSVGWVPD